MERAASVTTTTTPAKPGQPWRVEIDDAGRDTATFVFVERGDSWEVASVEVGTKAEPPTPELLEHVARQWDLYVAVALLIVGWNPTAEAAAIRKAAPQGRSLGTKFYKEIAERYRQLVDLGERPTATIALEHNVARSTASRWIRNARNLGFLRAAPPGGRRAGEVTLEKGKTDA